HLVRPLDSVLDRAPVGIGRVAVARRLGRPALATILLRGLHGRLALAPEPLAVLGHRLPRLEEECGEVGTKPGSDDGLGLGSEVDAPGLAVMLSLVFGRP